MADFLGSNAAPQKMLPKYRVHGKGLIRLMLFFVVLLPILAVFELACDTLLHPWAHAIFGAPPLTGSWLGSAPANPSRMLFLTLDRARNSDGTVCSDEGCPDVEGWFRYCEPKRQSNLYRISGDVGFWRGLRLKLGFDSYRPVWSNSRGPDFSPWEMAGIWDQADALTLTMREAPTQLRAPGPYRVRFHRSSEAEFQAACAQLK